MFRYLSQHIPARVKDFVPAVYFRSGAKVEDLFGGSAWDMISQKTRVCVVHVGTNDLKNPTKSVHSVLEHFKVILTELHKKSPELEIFISSVLPRGLNLWDRNTPVPIMSQRTEQRNSKLSKFNQLLWEFTLTESHLHFVNNDVEFWPTGQCLQTHLLAKDGLHLTERGVISLTETLVSMVEASQLDHRLTVPFAESKERESHVDSLEYSSVGSESYDYPPLPQSACVGSTDSPYVPADPSLIVTKADLCKGSPWAAMLQRVNERDHKVATKFGKPKRGNLPPRSHKTVTRRSKVTKEVGHVRCSRSVVNNTDTEPTKSKF